jgi:hypothetical protein
VGGGEKKTRFFFHEYGPLKTVASRALTIMHLCARWHRLHTAIGHWDAFVNCATLGRVFSQRDVLPKDGAKKVYGGERERMRKSGGRTRGSCTTKAKRRLPFVEIFRILLAPSEVAGRVFCITLYANETYALPEPRNKLHVYR